ncbi:MAG: hypothetical protein ACP5KN_02150 [Armatimonadota bacterium]
MSRAQFVIALAVVGIAGLVGGLFSDRMPGRAAFAQEAAPGVVEAREFRVVDEGGTLRAMLGMTEEGPRMRLCDDGGQARIGASAQADGSAGLTIYDGEGRQRVNCGVLPDGSAGFAVVDARDEPGGAMLRVAPDGHRGLIVSERGGEPPAVELAIDPAGVRYLHLRDHNEGIGCNLDLAPEQNLAQLILGRGHDSRQHACIVTTPEGSSLNVGAHEAGPSAGLGVVAEGPRLVISDEGGQSRVVAGAGEAGRYGLTIQDSNGMPRIHLAGDQRGEYGIGIIDAQGVPVFGVPFDPERLREGN